MVIWEDGWTYRSQSPVQDGDQAFDRGRRHGEGILRREETTAQGQVC
jgi:hypothetical protein